MAICLTCTYDTWSAPITSLSSGQRFLLVSPTTTTTTTVSRASPRRPRLSTALCCFNHPHLTVSHVSDHQHDTHNPDRPRPRHQAPSWVLTPPSRGQGQRQGNAPLCFTPHSPPSFHCCRPRQGPLRQQGSISTASTRLLIDTTHPTSTPNSSRGISFPRRAFLSHAGQAAAPCRCRIASGENAGVFSTGTGVGGGRVFFSQGAAGGGGQEEWVGAGVTASGLRSKSIGCLSEEDATAELGVLAEEIAAHDARYYQASFLRLVGALFFLGGWEEGWFFLARILVRKAMYISCRKDCVI